MANGGIWNYSLSEVNVLHVLSDFQVLVKVGLEEPRAIQVHPYKGWLFYTDWGDHAHIGRIGMDGTIPKQRNIITDNLGWPNALTIDYVAEHIIWADARYIFAAIPRRYGLQTEKLHNGVY